MGKSSLCGWVGGCKALFISNPTAVVVQFTFCFDNFIYVFVLYKYLIFRYGVREVTGGCIGDEHHCEEGERAVLIVKPYQWVYHFLWTQLIVCLINWVDILSKKRDEKL